MRQRIININQRRNGGMRIHENEDEDQIENVADFLW